MLTEGNSLTNSKILKKYGVVNDRGEFIKEGLRKVRFITDELKQSIYYEWLAQINKIKLLGLIPSHADSHHHIHRLIMDVFNKVIITTGIQKFRNYQFTPYCFIPKFVNMHQFNVKHIFFFR